MLILALAMAQPVAAQSADAGVDAAKRGVFATALRLLRPLAEQGNAKAQNALGMMHQRGHGVTRSFAEAVRWYRKAAKGGYVRA